LLTLGDVMDDFSCFHGTNVSTKMARSEDLCQKLLQGSTKQKTDVVEWYIYGRKPPEWR